MSPEDALAHIQAAVALHDPHRDGGCNIKGNYDERGRMLAT